MSNYGDGEVIVTSQLFQRVTALCPVTGDEQAILDRDGMSGLSKDQLVLYGEDFLNVAADRVPPGWLVKVEQRAMLTSEQAPDIRDPLEGVVGLRWRPAREAFRMAKDELRGWSELKRWGGGGS